MRDQLSFLGHDPRLPEGFKYEPDVLAPPEEEALLQHVRDLPLAAFEFHGFTGKRRVISFGWHYDFQDSQLKRADEIPKFLLPARERAAAFAALQPAQLTHVLITEYAAGAAIGWHRDKAVFGDVIGISLLSPCVFRLRRKTGTSWERASVVAEPRSAYLLSGAARSEWEHSIPAVDALRYSITFRTLR